MPVKSAKKTWVAVLVAAIMVVCVAVVALVGASAYFVARHVSSAYVETEGADAQFAGVRQRFAGQTPLIALREGGEAIVNRPAPGGEGRPITTIHALVYAADERKLVDISLPFWLVRLSPGDRFSFIEHGDFDHQRIQLSLRDVERHGPGLILDGVDRNHGRVLIWAE